MALLWSSSAVGPNVVLPRYHFSCSMRTSSTSIKVVVNGACTPIGKAAISAITKARGIELGGAVDTSFVGMDAGEVAGLEEPLELPIASDIVMVLGSLSQGTSPGVMVDFSNKSNFYENVREATAFGLRSVVAVENLDMDKVAALSTFCEKASMVSYGLLSSTNAFHCSCASSAGSNGSSLSL